MAETGASAMSETLIQCGGTGTAVSLVQPNLCLAVAAPCVIYLSTNNSDFLKHIDVRLLGDFLIGGHKSRPHFSEESKYFHCQFPKGRVSFPAESEE